MNSHASENAQQSADHDATLNIIRLAHAQSQKLAEQWLPITQQELEEDEKATASLKESFPYRPEQAGLGADLSRPSATDWRGVSIDNTGGAQLEKLRRQLLGRKAGPPAAAKRPPDQQATAGVKAQGTAQDRVASDDDDDEGGRSAAFKSKRLKLTTAASRAAEDTEAVDHDQQPESEDSKESGIQETNTNSKSAKRHSTFLDQILTERSTKKKRKRKRNKNRQSDQDK